MYQIITWKRINGQIINKNELLNEWQFIVNTSVRSTFLFNRRIVNWIILIPRKMEKEITEEVNVESKLSKVLGELTSKDNGEVKAIQLLCKLLVRTSVEVEKKNANLKGKVEDLEKDVIRLCREKAELSSALEAAKLKIEAMVCNY